MKKDKIVEHTQLKFTLVIGFFALLIFNIIFMQNTDTEYNILNHKDSHCTIGEEESTNRTLILNCPYGGLTIYTNESFSVSFPDYVYKNCVVLEQDR